MGHDGWKGARYAGQRSLKGKIEIVKGSPKSDSPSPSPPPPSKTVIKKVEESSPSPSPPPPSKVGSKSATAQSRPCQAASLSQSEASHLPKLCLDPLHAGVEAQSEPCRTASDGLPKAITPTAPVHFIMGRVPETILTRIYYTSNTFNMLQRHLDLCLRPLMQPFTGCCRDLCMRMVPA